MARESTAFGAGCASGTAAARAALAARKAAVAAGSHSSILGAPLSASVSGCSVRAMPGRNLLNLRNILRGGGGNH